jgi:putative nucleotidyltransferase with HDIG domain
VAGTFKAYRERFLLAIGGALIAATGLAALALSRAADWTPLVLVATLLVLAITADLLEVETKSLRISGSFLAPVLAMTLLGPAPAAAIGFTSTLAHVARLRPRRVGAVWELATFSVFPLLGGLAVREAMAITHVHVGDSVFGLVVFCVFLLTNALNFLLIAWGGSQLDGVAVRHRLRHDFLPVLPWELATALLTVGVVFIYGRVGISALVLSGLVILTFQYLLRELLTSQHRAEELEARSTQLAALQVGVLAAMVQTLGLRDRMTARHSAAVARYAREIAAAAGRSKAEQELVHTAGLLHDIGKFALPDGILLGRRGAMTEEDWALIRRHPEDGARVVRRVDGYGPVADIILLHHERLDGRGYPYGLLGEDVPLFARIVAVADAYDVMTARDSYRQPLTSAEACEELRRCAGTQFDPWVVETFVGVLERHDLAFRHADDADFAKELEFERRVRDFARGVA